MHNQDWPVCQIKFRSGQPARGATVLVINYRSPTTQVQANERNHSRTPRQFRQKLTANDVVTNVLL